MSTGDNQTQRLGQVVSLEQTLQAVAGKRRHRQLASLLGCMALAGLAGLWTLKSISWIPDGDESNGIAEQPSGGNNLNSLDGENLSANREIILSDQAIEDLSVLLFP